MREVAIIICLNVLESSVVCTLLGTYFFITILLEIMECYRRETRSVLGTGNTPQAGASSSFIFAHRPLGEFLG